MATGCELRTIFALGTQEFLLTTLPAMHSISHFLHLLLPSLHILLQGAIEVPAEILAEVRELRVVMSIEDVDTSRSGRFVGQPGL
jgi:hypothetical protein